MRYFDNAELHQKHQQFMLKNLVECNECLDDMTENKDRVCDNCKELKDEGPR
jgi:hypothetical protein